MDSIIQLKNSDAEFLREIEDYVNQQKAEEFNDDYDYYYDSNSNY